jgi:hypothetical protein
VVLFPRPPVSSFARPEAPARSLATPFQEEHKVGGSNRRGQLQEEGPCRTPKFPSKQKTSIARRSRVSSAWDRIYNLSASKSFTAPWKGGYTYGRANGYCTDPSGNDNKKERLLMPDSLRALSDLRAQIFAAYVAMSFRRGRFSKSVPAR